MAKILIKSVKLIGSIWISSGWIKTNVELDKSKLEEKRKMITSLFNAKQCLFIYEEKG